jgi:hypothetical protein
MKILKSGVEGNLKVKLEKLRSRTARDYFLLNISYPSQERAKNEADINKYIQDLEDILFEIEKLLKTYRKHIPNIWDQTRDAACYLLIGKVFNNLKTIARISKDGSSHELVELCRSAIESLDLVFLFLEDKTEKYLKIWFKGELVTNDEARLAAEKIINNANIYNDNIELPLKDIKSDVYSMYSLYTHSGYAALLDSVDVFYEDFDYKKYSGYHYTNRNLHLVNNVLENTLLGLKNAFIRSNDILGAKNVDIILKKVGHNKLPKEVVYKIINPYTKK